MQTHWDPAAGRQAQDLAGEPWGPATTEQVYQYLTDEADSFSPVTAAGGRHALRAS